ncbi:CPBP family intramembrane glutamic endopeptidase [Nonomuraea jiangxiensis]|uniref:CAAX protease self-immunity n=1 Tax=Nonomuraea jiangxiensis TaxID=633440 RepID=A0A1G9TUQ8_9ACTN|nr:CPBP family intramembrane glutamic endopeptidase [Nonomuraea jiangxiensis]SDM51469.1 CAAX protease self-immunity [Nonomuraea jiangxiensis]
MKTAVRVPPLVTLAVGVLLWYVPTLVERLARLPGDRGLNFDVVLPARWFAAALLLAFVLTVERRPLSSVGVRIPRVRDVLVTVGLSVLALVVGVVLYGFVVGAGPDQGSQSGQIMAGLSIAGSLHLIANAAVVEELFYRGLLMERIIDLTGRPWAAALVSYVLFVGGHVPGSGWATTLTMVAVGSLLLVGLYWMFRDLLLCAGAHAIFNLPILAGALAG